MSKPSDRTSSKASKPSGNQPAFESDFEQIFSLYYPRVRDWFCKRGFNPQDTEELAQDTFVRVARNLKGFREDCSLFTWIITIARRLASNHRRHQHALKRLAFEEPLDELKEQGTLGMAESSEDPDPLRLAIIQEEAQKLHRAIEALPPQQKRCFKLWVQGCKYREIEQLLGIKINTVKSNLHWARLRVQQDCPDLTADPNTDEEEAP